jgi:hypothetical protein
VDVDQLLHERSERDRFLLEHYSSPLPEEHQATFEGLDYFSPDTAWELTGEYQPTAPLKIPVPSSAGSESPYTMLGVVTISIGESVYRLTVLDDGDGGAFIPFKDGTSGAESYGGGRYVGVPAETSGTVTIDFNKAQNPWCVYDEEFTCPLPSTENWIAERIPAGAMTYKPPAGTTTP